MSDLLMFRKTQLLGGGATAVDGISATALVGEELCWATVSDVEYTYRMNITSGAAADGVNVIIPVVGTVGDKRWILQPTRTATETNSGIVELATDAETQTGSATNRAITPANLSARTATETRTGVVELATVTEAVAGSDTSRATTAAGVAAAVAVVANPKARSQGVNMTAATSGSTGITVADDDDIDFGTGNYTLRWKGSIPDYTPAADVILMQKTDAANGWLLQVDTTGVLQLLRNAEAAKSSTSAPSITDGTVHEIVCVVTTETASVAGSVVFYVDGIQLGSSVAITAGAPTTVNNAVSLYVAGTSAARSASVNYAAATYNRALTAAEVLDLYRNGIAESDRYGSQTAVRSDTAWTGATGTTPPTGWSSAGNSTPTFTITDLSGVANMTATSLVWQNAADGSYRGINISILNPGKRYRMVIAYRYAKAGGSSAQIQLGTIGVYQFVNTGTSGDGLVVSVDFTVLPDTAPFWIISYSSDVLQIAYLHIYKLGATLALEPANAQPVPGMWLDSSTNNLHAIYPAAGATLTRPKQDFVIRWVNTWAGTHEAQYLGGVNQAMLPAKCCITSIVGVIAGSTIEDIILGDGSDTDHWVAITTGLAAGTVNFTIANAFSDLTNYKLVVDPDANFTGSITWTIRGYIYQ